MDVCGEFQQSVIRIHKYLTCYVCKHHYHINCVEVEPSETVGRWKCKPCARKRSAGPRSSAGISQGPIFSETDSTLESTHESSDRPNTKILSNVNPNTSKSAEFTVSFKYRSPIVIRPAPTRRGTPPDRCSDRDNTANVMDYSDIVPFPF